MLTVEKVQDYAWVTGFPDGSDWLFRPETAPHEGSVGIVGTEHVWCFDRRSGRLQLYHAPTRALTATVQLGASGTMSAPFPVTASRDGRRLFVVQPGDPDSSLSVVDVVDGTVTATHGGLPRYLHRAPIERPDGGLLLETVGRGLVLLDPVTGERRESATPGGLRYGFLGASPDGRYWVRFDPTALPTRETSPGLMDRVLHAAKAERLYGVTMQLWEAFPLRFVRRIVVAWLKVEELPDEAHLRGTPARRAVWDAVAAATAAANAGPLDPPVPRSAYPAPYATDDAAWQSIDANLSTLARSWVRVVGWQPDGAAVWIATNSFLSCIGVDGTVSPRLYTQRLGLAPGTWLPVAAYWRTVVPLAGRKARVVYTKGEALFDGAPSATPHLVVAIPRHRDGWVEKPDETQSAERKELFRRIAALKAERSTVLVPLAGWTEADCVSAIEALTAKVVAGVIHASATDNEVRIVFDLNGERIPEARFFAEAGARFPGVAPAVRRLVDAYVDAGAPNGAFHFDPEAEAGVLSRAVRALGVLDRSAIPTLERYGLLVDAEHEYYFAGTTVPDVVKAHGWTDDVVDFVFWVLVRNYYNTLQEYGHVWDAWALRDAAVRREPRALARHLVSALADLIAWKDDPGRYLTGGFDQLAQQIPQPHEPWAEAFFEELERIAALRSAPPARP